MEGGEPEPETPNEFPSFTNHDIASFTNHDSSIEKLVPYEGGKNNLFDHKKKTFNITEEVYHSRDKYHVWITLDREVDVLKKTIRIYDWKNTELSEPVINELPISFEQNQPRPK